MFAPTAPPAARGGQSQSTGPTQDIFERADVDELRCHIWILTTALKQCELSSSRSSQIQNHSNTGVQQTFKTLCHMSTLLTVGLADDPAATRVSAVAGIVVPDGIVSLIATENPSPQRGDDPLENDQAPPPQTSKITRIVVGNDRRAKFLLTKAHSSSTDNETITFGRHLEDVATIVAFLLRRANTDRDLAFLGLFFVFTIRRSFRKLSARLENMYHIWGDLGPIAIMEEWYNKYPHSLADTVVKFDGLAKDSVQTLCDRLASHGVPSVGVCAVTSSNVCGWLAAVSAILKKLQALLPRERQVPPSYQETVLIIRELGILDTVLRSSFFKALGHSPVGETLRQHYEDCQKIHQEQWHPQWDADALQEDSELFDQEPGEGSLPHVQRYLQTITAWITACSALYHQHAKQDTPLHFFRLDSIFSFNFQKNGPQQLRGEYEKFLKTQHLDEESYEHALALIRKAISSVQACKKLPPVHAEAAIMALAYVSLTGKDADIPGLKDANVIFSTGEVPIGVSKKCCACCDLFAKYLQANPPQDKTLTFLLPGTHGTIYPWMVPPFSVPQSVLVKMCQELFTVFLRVFTTLQPSLSSTKSSPASATSEVYDVDTVLERVSDFLDNYEEPEEPEE
ncbi:hypothetical protein C2E23DRAFT_819836 [Lenzites betulinus]|nr:hypothetical protein C2E23DRAFT_819836 [Lenzites betulinus]